MRLMLGIETGEPWLLVEVATSYDPNKFRFTVINGAWRGRFDNGNIFIERDRKPSDTRVKIICDDQEKLCGDYNDVFGKFKENGKRIRQKCDNCIVSTH